MSKYIGTHISDDILTGKNTNLRTETVDYDNCYINQKIQYTNDYDPTNGSNLLKEVWQFTMNQIINDICL